MAVCFFSTGFSQNPTAKTAAIQTSAVDTAFLNCFNDYWREFRYLYGKPDTLMTFKRWKLGAMNQPFRHRFYYRHYFFYSGFKTKTHYFGNYFNEVPGFNYFDDFTARFKAHCEKYQLNKVQAAVTFVQSFNYQLDTTVKFFSWEPCGEKVTNHTFLGDVPKFPIETLMESGGDCEDLSILLAALLDKLGYDVVLINPQGHLMVGIYGKFKGKFVVWNGKPYYYIETTGTGWKIGELPPEISEEEVRVIPLRW